MKLFKHIFAMTIISLWLSAGIVLYYDVIISVAILSLSVPIAITFLFIALLHDKKPKQVSAYKNKYK